MKKYISILVIAMILVLLPATKANAAILFETEEPIVYPETTEYPDDPERCPDIASEAAIVMDAKTGQVLYEKDAYKTMYPASITKILTTLVALENGSLSSTLTMSEDAVWGIERGSSHIALDVGEQITLEQALYAVMLVSANEAAWGVAEHIGGTLENFCTMMNERAKELGCTNTHFVNANGLHDDNHYTCAYDMALITREAIKNPDFMKITATTYYEIPPTNLQPETRYLYQDNKLIRDGHQYYYEYAQGGKTGFTDQARGTLVAWAEKDGMQLICVTLHGYPSKVTYTDAKALFEYCFNNYTYTNPLSDYTFSEDSLKLAEDYLDNYYGGTNLGTLLLNIDERPLVVSPIKSAKALTTDIEFKDANIEDGIIGELVVRDTSREYTRIPIHFEGYISSTDDEAIEKAISDGIIKPEKKKSHTPIIVCIIIILIIAAVLLLRISYVKKQRMLYKQRRDKARQYNRRF